MGSKKHFSDLFSCRNVNFKSLFPFSPQHNFGKLSSNIKSKHSFEIRIVLPFQKCPEFLSQVPQKLRNCWFLGGQSIARHPIFLVRGKESTYIATSKGPVYQWVMSAQIRKMIQQKFVEPPKVYILFYPQPEAFQTFNHVHLFQ